MRIGKRWGKTWIFLTLPLWAACQQGRNAGLATSELGPGGGMAQSAADTFFGRSLPQSPSGLPSGVQNPPDSVADALDPAQESLDDLRENGELDREFAGQLMEKLHSILGGREATPAELERLVSALLAGKTLRQLAYEIWFANRPPQQAVFRMDDNKEVDADMSTWRFMDHFFTENPPEIQATHRRGLPHFKTFTRISAYCPMALYKCEGRKTIHNQAMHFLSFDPGCAPGAPWTGQPRSVGYVCPLPLPETVPLYYWYQPDWQAHLYNTHGPTQDHILVALRYVNVGIIGFVPR